MNLGNGTLDENDQRELETFSEQEKQKSAMQGSK
jgi:hypothetical protein